jgi:transcriptional regulator with XRE-family HTH domain
VRTTGQPFEGLGSALRVLRESRGLTLQEAGRRADVDFGNISRYENDETVPSLPVLGRLLKGYGCSVRDLADLLEGDKQSPAEDPFVSAVAGALDRLGISRPAHRRSEKG